MKMFSNRSWVGGAALLLVTFPGAAQKTPDRAHESGRFDPSTFVAIYEEIGKKKSRVKLYTPPNDTRILSADHESTIIFDLTKALSKESGGDVGLNNVYIRAELKTAKGSSPVEVVGYSLIGES